jgi:hypothetical protein
MPSVTRSLPACCATRWRKLTSEDAAAVGIDAPHLTYRALAELEGVDEKARRDAGIVAVARLDVS